QIDSVGYAEILERTEQLAVDGFWETDIGSNTSTKIVKDTLAVHTFRRRGEAKQHLRLEVFQCLAITVRRSMVGFVDDDIVVIIGRQLFMERLRIQRLYGNEQVIQRFRFISTHIKLAKIGVLQHACKSVAALFKNFLTVRNEQQTVCFS